jgi:hypothetical protein
MISPLEIIRLYLCASFRKFFQSHVFLIFIPLISYLFSSEINLIAQSSLIFRKLCQSLYNDTFCDHGIHQNKTFENNVQLLANDWLLWADVAFLVPAIFSVLYLASLTDRQSNFRTPMIVSVVGFIFQSFICVFASTQETYVCLWLLIVGQVLNGVFGAGSLAFISSCFSFISFCETASKSTSRQQLIQSDEDEENTNRQDNNRSVRFSVLEAATVFGRFFASLSSGFILGNKSKFEYYQRCYIISLSIFCVILVYLIILFHNLNKRHESAKLVAVDLTRTTNSESQSRKEGWLSNKLVFLDIWKTIVKKRSNNFRFYFLMLLLIYFIVLTLSFGVHSIDYLYLTKIPILLDQQQYGIIRGLNTGFRGFALLVLMPVLKRYFNMTDNVLYTLGLSSEIFYFLILAIAFEFKYIVYLGTC